MKVERANMNRSPVLLSDIGALELTRIIQSHRASVARELSNAEPGTHAFTFLKYRERTAGRFIEILEEAFPFLEGAE